MPSTAQKHIRTFLFPLGLALLLAALIIQEGTALPVSPQVTPMPTIDRLAEPTLPAAPSQADYGAQLYWLYCLPCHGDKGQGLTDEFRETYPPEDNNCWGRGCHGRNPYEGGFTLPPTVPRLIGAGALTKFSTVAVLNGYIRGAMPFEDPGVLTEDEYWQVTAFLLRENGISYAGQLDASSADQVLLPWVQPTPTLIPVTSLTAAPPIWPAFIIIFLLGGILFLWHTLRRKPNPTLKGCPMTTNHNKRSLLALILFVFIFSACQFPLGADEEIPTSTPEPPPVPTLTPTVLPPRTLTICLGAEPNTLYPLGGPDTAARAVLEAIYDGPIDVVGYKHQPVILEHVPNMTRGDALIESVPVEEDTLIVDADGNLAYLDTGMRVRPAGCRSDECAIDYDGVSSLEMDQMIVNFSLLEGLVWSDGEPLTSADSIYAFELAADEDTPGSKYLIDRTQIYEATDETTVQWWGIPGFIDPTYYTNFWAPLPKHAWEEFAAAELPQIDIASRYAGWLGTVCAPGMDPLATT